MVLGYAREWALAYVRSITRKIEMFLDVSGIDPTIHFFLRSVPQHYGDDTRLQPWDCIVKEKWCVYHREAMDGSLILDDPNNPMQLYTHVFEDKLSAYVGVYDTDGTIVGSNCLVIWDKMNCETKNQGYAPGRCPNNLFDALPHNTNINI